MCAVIKSSWGLFGVQCVDNRSHFDTVAKIESKIRVDGQGDAFPLFHHHMASPYQNLLCRAVWFSVRLRALFSIFLPLGPIYMSLFTDFSKKSGFWFCPGVNGVGGE